ncbi:MAG: LysE family translocator [Pseudomonadota bacterium]
MFDAHTIVLFMLAFLAINVSPGPSIVYASTVAISGGVGAALISVTGMSVWVVVHVLVAATGGAALLASSEIAFTLIKYMGAVYLMYLGVTLWMQSPGDTGKPVEKLPATYSTYFLKGVLVDLFNPKIALFFMAFFPQFITVEEGNSFQRTLILGLLFILLGWVVTSGFAIVAAKGTSTIKGPIKPWIEKWIPGGVLIALGVRLAAEKL